MDIALSGRGKMGSLVGASEEVRRGGMDSSLNDYAVCLRTKNLMAKQQLIIGIPLANQSALG